MSFGFGLSPVSSAVFSGANQATPIGLFANGEQGAWYDPSDLSTMFQDSAGTTPVTAVGQPVGLILDKSKGLVLGPELVTNGDFSNGSTGWTLGNLGTSTATISGGVATLTKNDANDSYIQSTATVVLGKTYLIEFDLVSITAGKNVGFKLGGGVTYPLNPVAGHIKVILVANGNGAFALYSGGTTPAVSVFDNISVKELPGNHAFQTTTTKRPLLSARVNLLTKTEDLTAWSALGSAAIIDATQFRVNSDAGIWSPGIANIGGSKQHTCKIVLKGTVGNKINIYLISTNGASGGGIQVTLTATETEYSFTITSGATVENYQLMVDPRSFFGVFSGTLNQTVFATKAQVVPADQASLPYQRVNTATDYDSVGFNKYLAFDGIDDALVTNSIDFTATDKMTVWAGVRKLSDAATGMLLEMGTASPYITAPESGANYGTRAGGGTGYNHATFAAPITNVISSAFDRAAVTNLGADSTRFNGVLNTSAVAGTPPITGNYFNVPLYIGSRAGTSLPFNGNIYSLVIRGAQSSDAQIASTEQFVNSKTGAY